MSENDMAMAQVTNTILKASARAGMLFNSLYSTSTQEIVDYEQLRNTSLKAGSIATSNIDLAILNALLPEEERRKYQTISEEALKAVGDDAAGYIFVVLPTQFEKQPNSKDMYKAKGEVQILGIVELSKQDMAYRLEILSSK